MSPDSPKSSLKWKNILGIFVLVLIGGVMLSSNIGKGPFNGKVDTGKVLGISFSGLNSLFNFSTTFNFIFKSQGLAKIVQENIPSENGEHAIYIVDLNDGENYSMNAYDIYPSASLYKIFLMAAVIKGVEAGNLSMEDIVDAKKAHLVEVYGEEDFGYIGIDDEEIIGFPVEEALKRVGRVSDNFASILLAEEIGWNKVQEMANESGATATKIKSPISTTASDIASFFKLLHEKKVISPTGSDKVIEFLKLNQLNNRIPAGVPEGVKVVHKTGELAGVRHDAGIVYLEGRPYIIVMMSKDVKNENEAIEAMANISKEVYEYFKNKK